MVDVEFVRSFAGADPGADDALLTACMEAAMDWYENAGVPKSTTGSLYKYWVANLAAWMYDNRGNAEALAEIPGYILHSVHQLRTYDDEVTT